MDNYHYGYSGGNQPIYGWSEMPTWAKALAAINGANQYVAQPIKGIYDVYNSIRDDQTARQEQAKLKQFAMQAQSPLSEIDAYRRDPKFQDAASLQELAQFDPRGTTEKVNGQWQERPDMSANPVYGAGLQAFQNQAQGLVDTSRGMGAQLGNVAMTPEQQNMSLARFAATKDQNEQLKQTTDNRAAITAAENLKKFSEEVLPILNDPNTSPLAKFEAVNIKGTQYGVPVERLKTMLDFAKETANPLEQITGGVGTGIAGQEQPALRRKYAADGSFIPVGAIKQQFEPKANLTTISNYMPAQETAFSKGVGEANAKRYDAAQTDKQVSTVALSTLDDLTNALNNTWGGRYSTAQYQVAKSLPGSDKNADVQNYEVAKNLSQKMAMDILQNFKGQISDGERKFALENSVNPNMEPSAQKRLIAIAAREHKKRIANADTLINSVETTPIRSNVNKTLKDSRPPLSSFKK